MNQQSSTSSNNLFLVTNNLLSLVYRTFLMEFGVESTRKVFGKSDLTLLPTPIPSFEYLYTTMIQKTAPTISQEYLIHLYTIIEKQLQEWNYPLHNFMEKLFSYKKGFSILPNQEILKLMEPHLYTIFNGTDFHAFVLQMATLINNKTIPQSSMQIMTTKERQEKIESYMSLSYDSNNPTHYLLNIDMWRCEQIRLAPQALNLPPFENVTTIADCQPIEELFSQLSYREDKLLVAGEEIGYKTTFGDFLATQQLTLSSDSHLGYEGVILFENVKLASGDVLKKGCFYGAPLYLIKAIYTPQEKSPHRFLRNLMQTTTAQEEELFLKEHHKLLKQSKKEVQSVSITYDNEYEKLYIDNKLFARSMPAKILFHFCKNYKKKKTTYTYQELLLSDFLNFNSLQPNINVRIQRLKEKLNKRYSQLEIDFSGKGELTFACHAPIRVSAV